MSLTDTKFFRAASAQLLALVGTLLMAGSVQAQNLTDIQFVAASSAGAESVTPATLSISWTGTMTGDALTLAITTAGTGGDPATIVDDFTAVTSLVIPGSSVSPYDLDIVISEDLLDENGEAILATITGITSYIGGTSALGGQRSGGQRAIHSRGRRNKSSGLCDFIESPQHPGG
ncbi:MAG: hypothetical protein ACI80V_000076 [Rhodothermales bacterium]|jgi:hypothetical protein